MEKDRVQKLVDFKNQLKEESDKAFDEASVEFDTTKEAVLLEESRVKLSIHNKLNEIIYGNN